MNNLFLSPREVILGTSYQTQTNFHQKVLFTISKFILTTYCNASLFNGSKIRGYGMWFHVQYLARLLSVCSENEIRLIMQAGICLVYGIATG